MRTPVFFILLIVTVVLPVSCAGVSVVKQKYDPVFLTDDKYVNPLPTQGMKKKLEVYQIIDGYYKSQTYSVEALVQINPDEINIVTFNSLGTQVYDLAYKNSGLVFNGAPSTTKIKPEYIVVDFQLCYFPSSVVKPMIRKAGLVFQETVLPDGWIRSIRDGKQLIIRIRRNGNSLSYKNHLRGYGFAIQEEPVP